MGGPPITSEVKNIVTLTWEQMMAIDGQTTAKEVHYSVVARLKAETDRKHRLPSLRAVQLIISKHKKGLEGLISEGVSIDEEWSMASLTKYEFSADAIPFLIKVWRYAINTGHDFTVMQAKWVARLYRVWDDTTLLWYHSGWYAEIERSSLVSGVMPNTFSPDTSEFLTDWETMTLMFTKSFKTIFIRGYLPVFRNKEGQIIEELLHYKNRRVLELFSIVPDASDDYHKEFFNTIRELPSLDSVGLNYDAKLVYLRFYTFIIKCPTWKDLSPKDAVDLIIALRDWIVTEYENVKNEPEYVQPFLHSPVPVALLSKVGYEIPYGEKQ